MDDRNISLYSAVAWVCWTVATATVALGIVVPNYGIGNLGVLFAAAGGTLHMRHSLCEMRQRERHAFTLGRESVRLLRD